MTARLGAVIFGIGVFAVVLGAGCAFYVTPAVARLPYDLTMCTATVTEDCLRASVAEAPGAQFLQTKGGAAPSVEIRTGTLRSTTEISPQHAQTAAEMTGDAVIWHVYSTVSWVETNEMVSQSITGVALDRDTAAAADWPNQFFEDAGKDRPSDIDFEGQLYKFPFGTQRQDYQYFDSNLRRALPITFQDTERIDGLETYRFQQTIPETTLTVSTDQLTALLNRFTPGATAGRITYTNTRTLWVEPASGLFVKVQEQQRKTLVPSTGTPIALLDATFTSTPETLRNSISSATDARNQLLLISRYLPIGAAVIGAILMVLGPWLARRRKRPLRDSHLCRRKASVLSG
ncbi:hypothetical protein FB565_003069 [Actinoplanes lutulentus]|uniref:DUF3068 family protein n=1 Tax=Actinoplanes lutulentus TaxID=1287878 RepID=A0A327Z1Z6_9ACTN|nr:DUF3068 domain-containing protein [Actinoplanes lutulentus]MBB2943356.1 hypothetical protein [Actinoplanes lutulentus]RAK28414.1 Protein of unknown function (DUF3068) [Actinoplanes lutulentus]